MFKNSWASLMLFCFLCATSNAGKPFTDSDDDERPIRTRKCPPNQVWNYCGSACPLTCKNYLNPPKTCTKQCVVGCECISGYVKDDEGNCVRTKDCKPYCPDNSTFSDHPTNCRTCESLKCQNWTNVLKRGCYCDPGFVRNEKTGDCILPRDCPKVKKCGPNQEWSDCDTACPLTCENYLNPPKYCTHNCVIGCRCKKGYLLDPKGNCVTKDKCPSTPKPRTKCPTNSTSCQNCPKTATNGCHCDKGYLKDLGSGKCVLPNDCPDGFDKVVVVFVTKLSPNSSLICH